nr:dTDP-4-dehydrorhamnose reductase [uncultured Methanospirillum sp.]
MRIVITGSSGQLGKDITKACRNQGHMVTVYGSKDLDITRYEDVLSKIQELHPDIIINCAADNAVDQAETDWEKAFSVNGLGPKYLAIAASAVNAVLIHYSTDYIFSGTARYPYTLDKCPAPISRYGESKLLGEQMVMRHSTKYFLIRVSWVFGPGNTNFVKKVLEWSDNNNQIVVVDDQVSSPTYTQDLARATMDIMNSKQFGLYHISNTGYCSRFEWAKYILNLIGWTGTLNPGKSDDFKTPATRPKFSVLDNFGTKQTIGYDLPHWQDATERFLKEIERI